MQLRENEQILHVWRRHKTPFVFSISKILIVALPFYVIVYFAEQYVSAIALFVFYLAVSLVVGFFITYLAFIYFLDRLVLTNSRVIFINWVTLLRKEESETDLSEIQDIKTESKGFLARLHIFDYGIIRIETASSKTTIVFDRAPKPEAIKNLILIHLKKAGAGA